MSNSHSNRTPLRILHLEDSLEDHLLVARAFAHASDPIVLQHVERLGDFQTTLTHTAFDLVLADYRLAGFTAIDAWQWMQGQQIRLPFVLLSGAIGESAAVQAIQAGISDYLPKSELGKLRHVIQRALEMHAILRAKELADAELAQSEKRLAEFANHLQATIEQERSAIAREIHDDIGGSLAAIRFDLAWLQRHTTDAQVLAHVQAATQMLQHAVTASQRIMMNLRPAILDHGLAAAVQWLGESFASRTGIETVVSVELSPNPIAKAVELTVFRTAQESLTNVTKHARCNRVHINLTSDCDFVTLEVGDNGQGLDKDAVGQTGGFGLKGLLERVKTVDGWIDISATPGAGTTITLTAPLNPEKGDPRP